MPGKIIPKLLWPLAAALLGGCALLKPFPPPVGTPERLAMFPSERIPLEKPATIYWDEHQIPFIEVEDDTDLPLLLGMVHAHLRLGQMELLRRVSQGRLAELFGPLAADIDHSLRIVDFARAVPEILAELPAPTRTWLDRYTEGINVYTARTAALPPELEVLGIEPTRWSAADVLAIGRLAATDVNWLYWFFNMKIKDEPQWPEYWERMLAQGATSHPSFSPADGSPLHILESTVRSGSNAAVVAGSKSASGSALMAGDPHLGLMLPNFWVILGCRAPSYQMVGLTMPGLPVVLVGRNEEIAWGGTNMLALSSTFYDVSAPEYDDLAVRDERIAVRWWFDKTVSVRDSRLGPLVSEAPLLEDESLPRVALTWRGHLPSDEITAFLEVNRARSWDEFFQAFASYAVSGQNMLYADREGTIGQVAAVSYSPAAGRAGREFFADPAEPAYRWSELVPSTEMPSTVNPEKGYLVSTNNVPVQTDPPLSLFGNSNDRYHALASTIEALDRVRVEDLMRLQTDVYSRTSHRLAARFVEAGSGAGLDQPLLEALRSWDGRYEVDSTGAAAFELAAFHLASRYYTERYGEAITAALLRSPAVYGLLLEDLARPDCRAHLDPALAAAAADFSAGPTWGDLHELTLRHPLGAIPLIGARYRFGSYPVGGSTNTVMKRAHGLDNEKRAVTYGANARHISDLADPDANFFVLVGGQDGFWGSTNYLDLYDLWRQGDYVRLPLSIDTVRRQFPHRMVLQPRAPQGG